ncbi:MAG: hypothetical protein OEM49_09005 [Myxococcales bacterium]|nr:hypothetical protein [Myxococcales bacterium]MDH5307446.1 hypothetical protein [Myxococcales bacterium]
MPILPLVDLFILLGTGALGVGFVLKAVSITTHYRPTILGFSSLDFALIAGVSLAMALVLVARTWLKLNEPALAELRRRLGEEEARRRVRAIDEADGNARAAASREDRNEVALRALSMTPLERR